MNKKYTFFTKKMLSVLLIVMISNFLFAQTTKDATSGNSTQIKNWAKDGVTKIINVPAGTYNFTTPLIIQNNGLEIRGASKTNTIFKLTAKKNTLIDATGNNAKLTNLTLDGANNQNGFGNTIFRFNQSKGHRFENVDFKNSLWDAIGSTTGYATDNLFAKNCNFSNINFIVINILNRNTNVRGGSVVTSVDKVIVNNCTFNEGYLIGITADNGNDRKDNGNGQGPRYTQSTSLSGTTIKNCTFKRTRKFHIAMVQSSNMIINNNTFDGVTEVGNPSGAESLHFEQFSKNIEIYNNTFSMSNNLEKSYNYILFGATEGHKRVTQQRPSNTYKNWTYNIGGGNARRASTSCASTGHTNKDCKRDVHVYGPRNIYIAGNTFNSSSKISKYITMKEADGLFIGKKKNGTTLLNDFKGGNNTTKKISLGGNDEGSCNVIIQSGQNIATGNVSVAGVKFDLSPCKIARPNKIGNNNLPFANTDRRVLDDTVSTNSLLSVSPNPASSSITINSDATNYTLNIYDVSGKIIKSGNETNKKIQIQDLDSGMYYVTILANDGRRRAKKLIIK